jgi:glycosidase
MIGNLNEGRTSLKLIIIIFATMGCNTIGNRQVEIGFPEASTTPEWTKNMSIYEVNIRQYTPEGTINAFSEHLQSIKELGVEILWVMPVFPVSEKFRKADQNTLIEEIEDPEQRKKYLGSYYSTNDYKAINPDLGTFDDLRALVQKVHALDMKIILDIAVNHTGWDHPWLKAHPEYYTRVEKGSTPWNPTWMKQHPKFYAELSDRGFTYPIDGGETDWWDTADLNYNSQQLRMEMIEILKFWVQEFNIDGYRCDMAMRVPIDFWEDARKALDEVKPVFMLAEAEEAEHLNHAFDMNYTWELLHITEDIAAGTKTAQDIRINLRKDKEVYSADAYRMRFTSNHDENSWAGTVSERYGDGVQTFAALTVMLPGMPLIYSGQEAGLDKRLKFFEKDTIDWQESELRSFYTTLLHQKKLNHALWNGEAGGGIIDLVTNKPEEILAFIREKDGDKILAIFNLSSEASEFEFSHTIDVRGLGDLFKNESQLKLSTSSISMEPWEYIILTSKQ